MSAGAGLVPAHELVEAGLAAAGSAGCVVLVDDVSEAELRFANNTTTTNGVRRARSVTVVALADVEGGTAAGSLTRSGEVDVEGMVRHALDAARRSPAADDAAPLLTGAVDAAFGEPAPTTDLSVLSTVLAGLPGAFERAAARGTVLAGYVAHGVTTTSVGTSAGLRRRHVQATGSLELTGRADGGARSGWEKVGTSDFAGVTLEQLEERLARRLAWSTRRVELEPGRYEAVLPPSAVAELMANLYGYAGGQDAEDGRTAFSGPDGTTRLGERLSELAFELRSDPAEPGLECLPFVATGASSSSSSVFDNGMPLGRTRWIEEGRLARLRYHRAGAARSGVPAAEHVDNLVLELPGATGSDEDLVASTGRGLLLNSLWYIRLVDPTTLLLTGLTRDGVYLVEDGRVVGAANNFRFNESPVSLLARATEAGATVRTIGREAGLRLNRTKAPPLRIPDFNMSSVSPAS